MSFKSSISRALPVLLVLALFLFLGDCREEPDCIHFPDRQGTTVPFIFVDEVSGENLLPAYYSENPKRIMLDSLALFNHALERFPSSPRQWILEKWGARGYVVFIYVFDQSQVPHVDILTPGSVTYYLYSGKSDYDTIVFNYSFERGKHCYSETNDTLNCLINGRPPEYSKSARFDAIDDIFAIKK